MHTPNVINNVARYIEPMLQKPVNVSDKCIRELTNNTIYRLLKLSTRIISASLAPDITDRVRSCVPTHAHNTALCDPVMGRIAIMADGVSSLLSPGYGPPFMRVRCVCYNDCFISAVLLWQLYFTLRQWTEQRFEMIRVRYKGISSYEFQYFIAIINFEIVSQYSMLV